jgi:hypothetical protein
MISGVGCQEAAGAGGTMSLGVVCWETTGAVSTVGSGVGERGWYDGDRDWYAGGEGGSGG